VAIPVAGLIAPISGAILYMDGILGLAAGSDLHPRSSTRRAAGLAAFLWLTDKPEHATWLAPEHASGSPPSSLPNASARRASATNRCGG